MKLTIDEVVETAGEKNIPHVGIMAALYHMHKELNYLSESISGDFGWGYCLQSNDYKFVFVGKRKKEAVAALKNALSEQYPGERLELRINQMTRKSRLDEMSDSEYRGSYKVDGYIAKGFRTTGEWKR